MSHVTHDMSYVTHDRGGGQNVSSIALLVRECGLLKLFPQGITESVNCLIK